jgi:cysteine-rich repeat protein
VTDAGEACDDGNLIDADGCEADCTLPGCGNGILDPEDFEGATCYQQIPFIVGGFPDDVKIADIDADGFQDVVFADIAGNNLVIAFGDGLGGIDQTSTIALNSQAFLVQIGNLGGSTGFLDVAVSGADNKVIIVKHTGPRSFTNFATATVTNTISDFVVGDFTNDGKDDIMVIGTTLGTRLYIQNNNNFNAPTLVDLPFFGPSTNAIETGDVNNDGNQDSVVIQNDSSSCHVVIAKGKGDGTFSFSTLELPEIKVSNSTTQTVTIFDRENNGQSEILVSDDDSGTSAIVISTGAIPVDAEPFITTQTIERVSSGDFDLDGETDFISYLNNKKLILLLSSQNFQEREILSSFVGFPIIGIGDINQDGILDILSEEPSSTNNPSGIFLLKFNE